ncbi:Lactose transport system permease protein LacF [Tritonibacter multivorans]|uniref:Lactose transport system permease protein LacF n=1 Tax=Tritonibacter multivorans TaxID=928856 RepID=A0A0P1FZK8_9RHOB|nr:sugar ABC transporter permease [Tritonibacter multivorans]MDA7422471.1 sugar ABC transporter permease [Tritonibacter multivorans]CUH74880.1 Lactose transport system permease protein LacF [Tritonibacter multivorans]SFD43051.1 carbohydrate ABC transporter membrane protein 1, CUT1 family (TC 3.A.1.1.-) [Tritonibacter multivorans]
MIKSHAHIWFIGPALVLMTVILLIPILIAMGLSVTDYSLGNMGAEFVGFENYEKIFTRSAYEKMFGATFRYVFVVVPLTVGLGLGSALLIHSLGRFGDIYKTIYFLPVMAALIAMAIVWEFAFHPTIGVINSTLERGCGTWLELWTWYAKGCERSFPLWLQDRDYAIWTVSFIGVWQGFGFNMVLYLAGLTSIPRSLYDAAEMDGAKRGWDRFRLVTWPLLGPTTVFVVTISFIRSFQVFDMVEAFYPQGGGPSKSVFVMMFAIYEKGIQQNLMGIGAAITVVFLAFVMVLTLIQRWLVERRTHYA